MLGMVHQLLTMVSPTPPRRPPGGSERQNLGLDSDVSGLGYVWGLVFERNALPPLLFVFRFSFCGEVEAGSLLAPAGPLPSFFVRLLALLLRGGKSVRQKNIKEIKHSKRAKNIWAVNHLASSCPVNTAGSGLNGLRAA